MCERMLSPYHRSCHSSPELTSLSRLPLAQIHTEGRAEGACAL